MLDCDIDGNCLCIMRKDFINLAESEAIFIELNETLYPLKQVVSKKQKKMVKTKKQEGKDVFEYSIFGSPNQKIGDFVQTKLGVFL